MRTFNQIDLMASCQSYGQVYSQIKNHLRLQAYNQVCHDVKYLVLDNFLVNMRVSIQVGNNVWIQVKEMVDENI
jgi:hypothetical protein